MDLDRPDRMPDDDQPIEVTVIGGYLGAGKTTLLNHLLRTGTGRRTLVVVNDFGSINIDRELIVSADGGTLALGNGCVCCTLAGTLQQMLLGVGARPQPPELLVIEASGVSDPMAIAHEVDLPGFRLDSIVVVVDAETIGARVEHAYLGRTIRAQLAAADVVVLNKLDLVDSEQQVALRDQLRSLAPGAVVVGAHEGQVAPELLLGARRNSTSRHGDTHDHDHPHADHTSWTWVVDGLLERDDVECWLGSFDDDIVRAKGILALTDSPDHRTVLQVTGRRRRLTLGDAWGAEPPRSQVVAIGLPGSRAPEAPPLPFDR